MDRRFVLERSIYGFIRRQLAVPRPGVGITRVIGDTVSVIICSIGRESGESGLGHHRGETTFGKFSRDRVRKDRCAKRSRNFN